MMVSGYLPSNIVRLTADNQFGSSQFGDLRSMTNGLGDRHKFLQVPTRIEEFDFHRGLEFLGGIFNEGKLIDRLRIHNNGIYCEARQPTEVIQEFIDDVVEWVRQDFGITVEYRAPPNVFALSSIELVSDASLASALREFSLIGEKITALLASYGNEAQKFEPTRLAFHCDQTAVTGIKQAVFTFERREGQPFDKNLFFSSAPLKTKDHLELLNELERLLAD